MARGRTTAVHLLRAVLRVLLDSDGPPAPVRPSDLARAVSGLRDVMGRRPRTRAVSGPRTLLTEASTRGHAGHWDPYSIVCLGTLTWLCRACFVLLLLYRLPLEEPLSEDSHTKLVLSWPQGFPCAVFNALLRNGTKLASPTSSPNRGNADETANRDPARELGGIVTPCH
jgi:hypothetical protein